MLDRDPFDDLARDYDAAFTRSCIGALMRSAVWQRLDVVFEPGEHVLELNCGTGEDALHLASRGLRVHATDASHEMIEVARAKLGRSGHGDRVSFEQRRLEQLDGLETRFDGALSNFGGLNCVADLDAVARSLAALIRPGGRVILCIMGPTCAWEWAWFLAHAQPAKAFRRLAPGGTTWHGLTIRYPSVDRVRRVFSAGFSVERQSGLGTLIPPSYAESWAREHADIVTRLAAIERRLETRPLMIRLADHYLLELRRRPFAEGTARW